jgi:phenylalanyl-tRNA synthetase beta chain
VRNASRGLPDVGLYETGHVFVGPGRVADHVPGVSDRPSAEELAGLDAALPPQPRHLGVVLAGRCGERVRDWADAVEAVLAVGRALRLALAVRAADVGGTPGPWHPGRCAELLLEGRRVGLAGELHPRTVQALGLPARTCAAEANLDVLVEAAVTAGPVPAPLVSHFPRASVDVALVVEASTPAADVEAALRDGAGPLLEELRLFDVYTGPQVGQGRRSLAYALRLRAADRTLTDTEVLAVRDAAVAEAARRTGAALRGA